MGQQVGLLERRVVVRPISIVKTISKLTNSFTMMKFLAMFCLFIALFNEMEAKPIEAKPWLTLQDDMVSERKDKPKPPPAEDDDHPHPPPPEGEEDEAEVVDEREDEEEQDEEDDHPHPPPPEDDDHPHPPPP